MHPELRLQVSDDGCGFDSEKSPLRNDSFGLIGMRERAREIHAEFTIVPLPKRGTQVMVVLHLSGALPFKGADDDEPLSTKS